MCYICRMAVIGIFDSGAGGLSVYREIRRLLPEERYIYFSDNAFCPYGDKDPDFIRERSAAVSRLLTDKGAEVIVVACNTATAAAISSLRESFSVPFIGMEPAVKPAALGTKSGVIGVLATAGTLKGSKYLNTKGRFADNVQIIERVGKGFVELVESGELTGERAESTVRAALSPLLSKGADRIVLGCTHYPFLLDSLKRVTQRLLGEEKAHEIQFIDPAPAVAKHLKDILKERGIGLEGERHLAAEVPSSGDVYGSEDTRHTNIELLSSGDPAPMKRIYALCAGE